MVQYVMMRIPATLPRQEKLLPLTYSLVKQIVLAPPVSCLLGASGL